MTNMKKRPTIAITAATAAASAVGLLCLLSAPDRAGAGAHNSVCDARSCAGAGRGQPRRPLVGGHAHPQRHPGGAAA